MSDDLPGAVLFACGQNCIRSPMAEGLMKHFYGHRVHVQSCGVKIGENDMFVQAVMDEMGIDLSSFHPRSFEELEDTNFDLVITLSPRAHHKAMEMTRTMAIEVEYWPTLDPSMVVGSRDQIIDSYRSVRDGIITKLKDRFGILAARGV
ncbi:Arsenate reductase glutaredoxin-coupled, LMWP family [hydrothermal vent metagenome]|uniref:Arsenate reductase glutaredoxin-coupled, LMWP family n=1 Tax=hydrothermal vent metagenome TaxID=652676 RepID=A0A3B0RV99_9ZZZZ